MHSNVKHGVQLRIPNYVAMKMIRLVLCLLISSTLFFATARAQEAVTPSANAEALFTSSDPKLHANKQVVYQIIRELIEAGHWDRADRYLTERYIQHNPNAQSGRDAVVRYFTEVLKVRPGTIPRTVETPQGSYSTTWYDTWRLVNGKADEHWDPALRGEVPDLRAR